MPSTYVDGTVHMGESVENEEKVFLVSTPLSTRNEVDGTTIPRTTWQSRLGWVRNNFHG